MKRFIALAAAALVPVLAAAQSSTWKIDPAHSESAFAVKHLVVTTVRGHFGKTTGAVRLDEGDVRKSAVEATIDATTVDTRVPDRDKHLRSPDFFDAEKYPTITFTSTRVEKGAAPDQLKVTGNLTMHGTTKPITLDVTYSQPIKDPKGEERRAFSASGKLNRKDYGLTWSKAVEAGPVVGDEVAIQIELETIRSSSRSSS